MSGVGRGLDQDRCRDPPQAAEHDDHQPPPEDPATRRPTAATPDLVIGRPSSGIAQRSRPPPPGFGGHGFHPHERLLTRNSASVPTDPSWPSTVQLSSERPGQASAGMVATSSKSFPPTSRLHAEAPRLPLRPQRWAPPTNDLIPPQHAIVGGYAGTCTCAATASVRFVIRGGFRCARGARSWRGCWGSAGEGSKRLGIGEPGRVVGGPGRLVGVLGMSAPGTAGSLRLVAVAGGAAHRLEAERVALVRVALEEPDAADLSLERAPVPEDVQAVAQV